MQCVEEKDNVCRTIGQRDVFHVSQLQLRIGKAPPARRAMRALEHAGRRIDPDVAIDQGVEPTKDEPATTARVEDGDAAR